MRLTSPDEVLIKTVDGLLGLPQARGIPLPLTILPLSVLPLAGYLVSLVAAVMLAVSAPAGFMANTLILVVVFSLSVLLGSYALLMRARRCSMAARHWTPRLVETYRADALRARATQTGARYMLMVVTLGAACAAFAIMDAIGSFRPGYMLALVGAGLTVSCIGNMLVRYGDCAMPRTPT